MRKFKQNFLDLSEMEQKIKVYQLFEDLLQ